MRIERVHIENFRSIRDLEVPLDQTTVFIGQNNAGKTAIMDALRIVLTRRWGQRGTGFTENDVHKPSPEDDPRTLPPVAITIFMEEASAGEWHQDMLDALDDFVTLSADGRNKITLKVTCAWSADKEAFEPSWQFLDSAGSPLPARRRSLNLSNFFDYLSLFWLGALRDAPSEFTPRSRHWGRLLANVRIPETLEEEVMAALSDIDARILAADPLLGDIAGRIGQATRVAIGETHGDAKLNTLPLEMEEMIQRTRVVFRNEESKPWLPIGSHGQGLQSLAVIFLFQAAAAQQLDELERPGASAIFAIEEPEAHLHPQAARALWSRIYQLNGQRLLTTHSPYFLQHVPLRDIRLVCLQDGVTRMAAIPAKVVSDLAWIDAVETWIAGSPVAAAVFFKEAETGRVAARRWFSEDLAEGLQRCFRNEGNYPTVPPLVRALRHNCRLLPSLQDESDLSFHGRRIRGEMFFARRWLLVEGVCEYLLTHAVATALDYPLDDHGITVIDFKNSGSAGIYPPLADAFGIAWHMISDGDDLEKHQRELLKRGYVADDLVGHSVGLSQGDLEKQLLSDGHETRLRDILAKLGVADASTCSGDELYAKLQKNKTEYMSELAIQVAADIVVAESMPAPFVNHIKALKGSSP
ncbi:MAG: AAA family ATPase [Hyphomonadaceae bacterium]